MAGYGEFRCKELRVAADQAALPLDWSKPDPPQIAWFELLPDFRGVTDRQKRGTICDGCRTERWC